MKTAEILLWTIIAILIAVVLERLISHFCRRADEDNSRLEAAIEAIDDQKTAIDALLAKEAVPTIMKECLIDFAEAAMTKLGAHAMLDILLHRNDKPLTKAASSKVEDFIAAAEQLQEKDPEAYELYRTFIYRVPIMAFLQRSETYKAMGQLSLRLAAEREPGAARDAAVMRQESIVNGGVLPAAA
jgi:hypothetical protein